MGRGGARLEGRDLAARRESSAAASRAAMGFGLAFGCPEGHSALLQLQESEVRLLEGLRKWMGQRAKSDREYAALLHQMHSLAGKQEGGRQPHLGGQIGQVGSPGLPFALLRKLFGLPWPAPSRAVAHAGRAASAHLKCPRKGAALGWRKRAVAGLPFALLRWGWVCPGASEGRPSLCRTVSKRPGNVAPSKRASGSSVESVRLTIKTHFKNPQLEMTKLPEKRGR